MLIFSFTILLFFQSIMVPNVASEKSNPSPNNLIGKATCVSMPEPMASKLVSSNIIFQSTDDGQSWQDISSGLPSDLKAEEVFVSNNELYISASLGMYRSSAAHPAPVWTKEFYFDNRSTHFSSGRSGLFAFNSQGHFYKKLYGTGIWLPTFKNFEGTSIRTIMETQEGIIFIGSDKGIFKSADQGNSWKHVFSDGWVIRIVESDGVLLCTNNQGILRSTDQGENWNLVISEGGVGIAVEQIEGGFAAITYNTESKTRRVRTSTDSGKTWQAIDAGLPAQASIASIKQVGMYFFCGHPDGIFRSANKGKTWQLLLPAVDKKVFNLSVSDKVIFALPKDAGC